MLRVFPSRNFTYFDYRIVRAELSQFRAAWLNVAGIQLQLSPGDHVVCASPMFTTQERIRLRIWSACFYVTVKATDCHRIKTSERENIRSELLATFITAVKM